MSINFVWWTTDEATFEAFCLARGFMVEVDDGEGGTVVVNANGFDSSLWNGTGALRWKDNDRHGFMGVDGVSADEFTVEVGVSPPAWVQDPLEAHLQVDTTGDGKAIYDIAGNFDRIQSTKAVFTRDQSVPILETDTVGLSTPSEQVAPGIWGRIRLSFQLFTDDVLVPSDTDPDKYEQWAQSVVAKEIKDAGQSGDIANGDLTYWQKDGVRLFRAQDFEVFARNRNITMHEWTSANAWLSTQPEDPVAAGFPA